MFLVGFCLQINIFSFNAKHFSRDMVIINFKASVKLKSNVIPFISDFIKSTHLDAIVLLALMTRLHRSSMVGSEFR